MALSVPQLTNRLVALHAAIVKGVKGCFQLTMPTTRPMAVAGDMAIAETNLDALVRLLVSKSVISQSEWLAIANTCAEERVKGYEAILGKANQHAVSLFIDLPEAPARSRPH